MPEPLKNMYTRAAFEDFSAAFEAVYAGFDPNAFLSRVFDDQWDTLELRARSRHITQALHQSLPSNYRTALDLLRKAAPAVKRHGFLTIVFPDFVQQYGLDDWDASIPALEEFTVLCTSEWAVRPFIVQDQDRMMAQMRRWADHENPEVRRLATEGCRPLLPWGIVLPGLRTDPSPILPILETLKDDESESVRRSVANNLNDISKDHPDIVIDTLRHWKSEGDTPEIQWIVNHALRTLLKKGHPAALELLGYGRAAIAVTEFVLERDWVQIGDKLPFAFTVESRSDAPQELLIDYVIHLLRSNGKHNQKVFKLTKRTLQPAETLRIARNHSLALVTTRRYYPGEHIIELQINGQRYGAITFRLVE